MGQAAPCGQLQQCEALQAYAAHELKLVGGGSSSSTAPPALPLRDLGCEDCGCLPEARRGANALRQRCCLAEDAIKDKDDEFANPSCWQTRIWLSDEAAEKVSAAAPAGAVEAPSSLGDDRVVGSAGPPPFPHASPFIEFSELEAAAKSGTDLSSMAALSPGKEPAVYQPTEGVPLRRLAVATPIHSAPLPTKAERPSGAGARPLISGPTGPKNVFGRPLTARGGDADIRLPTLREVRDSLEASDGDASAKDAAPEPEPAEQPSSGESPQSHGGGGGMDELLMATSQDLKAYDEKPPPPKLDVGGRDEAKPPAPPLIAKEAKMAVPKQQQLPAKHVGAPLPVRPPTAPGVLVPKTSTQEHASKLGSASAPYLQKAGVPAKAKGQMTLVGAAPVLRPSKAFQQPSEPAGQRGQPKLPATAKTAFSAPVPPAKAAAKTAASAVKAAGLSSPPLKEDRERPKTPPRSLSATLLQGQGSRVRMLSAPPLAWNVQQQQGGAPGTPRGDAAAAPVQRPAGFFDDVPQQLASERGRSPVVKEVTPSPSPYWRAVSPVRLGRLAEDSRNFSKPQDERKPHMVDQESDRPELMPPASLPKSMGGRYRPASAA
eukprot:TRINITY_DN54371_c0_g1_i1.p1 TRINITY_DN54371_c0_g1~~TRINITY_DN54371_c0_g1_i1.p1  ORF type:complete len:603 (+),score=154.92 TRINITY_DN54371_c0_g1_i1:137-1945(+)